MVSFTRTTASGAKITYTQIIDKPTTKIIRLKKGLKEKKTTRKNKILKEPKEKLPSTDPKKFITNGLGGQSLVREGRTGYFNEEMITEKRGWLS